MTDLLPRAQPDGELVLAESKPPGSPGADHGALVAASLGQPQLFGEIYHAYFDPVHRYLAGRLGLDAADDLTAEVFMTAFRCRKSFDPDRGTVRAWLFGIATNLVARHRRAEARRYHALGRVAGQRVTDGEADRVVERVSAEQLRGPLMAALARLPARERDALLLVALGGLTYQETAAAMSIAPATVGSRLTRARKKVRAALSASPARDS
ncbi:MAG: RNA polymerase sigma factor [Streptosporangiaceae bacterium]